MNSNAEIQRRSGIQFKFLHDGTSKKVPKAGRTYYSARNDRQENRGKEGGVVGIVGCVCRVAEV